MTSKLERRWRSGAVTAALARALMKTLVRTSKPQCGTQYSTKWTKAEEGGQPFLGSSCVFSLFLLFPLSLALSLPLFTFSLSPFSSLILATDDDSDTWIENLGNYSFCVLQFPT